MAICGFMAKSSTSGQGRPRGSLNKATKELKLLAQEHCPAAMGELARLATGAESETARVAAIKELFDRGYGKAVQAISGPNDGPIEVNAKASLDVSGLSIEQLRALASIKVST